MANSFRYFNLKQLSPGSYAGLNTSWTVESVVDMFISDRGAITGSANDFPHKGAGTEKGQMLASTFSYGGITAGHGNRVFDYGAIA